MIKFKIDTSSIVFPKTNAYRISLGFMLGDGDDYESVNILVPEDEFESNTEEFGEFVQSILDCIKHDEAGRSGIQSSYEFAKEYIGIKNWSVFCDDIHNALEYNDEEFSGHTKHSELITYDVPCMDGWYYSYESIDIVYYDSKGILHKVIIYDEINERSIQ